MLKMRDSNNREIEIKFWKFPAGETGVKILSSDNLVRSVSVSFHFESNDDLINLAFLCDAVREKYTNDCKINLFMYYFPYARQDRYCDTGESFSLKVISQFLNSLDFHRIYVQDMHSEVMKGLFKSGVVKNMEQHTLQHKYVTDIVSMYSTDANIAIVAPDAGATKKAAKAAQSHGLDLVEFNKKRNPSNGLIEKITCSIDKEKLNSYDCLIVVDDICDNGGTFIALGDVINNQYNFKGDLHLIVTHGIFGKGLSNLNTFYKSINWVNSVGNKVIK